LDAIDEAAAAGVVTASNPRARGNWTLRAWTSAR
jgi:hypothetical protein